jgi:hypothetical protein
MELRSFAQTPCPADIVAVAINNNEAAPHCGIVYTDANGAVRLCDMQYENTLENGDVPPHYFWAKIRLDDQEVLQVAVFVELVIQRAKTSPLPYSTIYSPDGFDITGRIRGGVGLTCATFIVAVFDYFRFQIVDLATWRHRPKQDAAFRERIINLAVSGGENNFAARLMAEKASFRLKPWELCASATHKLYPVRFRQATKLVKTLSKLVRKAIS